MKKRKIVAITGTRAEYGLARNIFKEIEKNQKLELELIVTGMHLENEFDFTIKEIKKDCFKISAKIKNLSPKDTCRAMAESIGRCILETAKSLDKIKPDILLALTDLSHTLAGAIAGAYMNIPVAHLHGGDVSGSIDESARHAITKFSHIHFPATKKSAERIIKMGEDPWRVFVAGAPGLDDIFNLKLLPQNEIIKKFNINFNKPFFLVLQHAVTTETEKAGKQIRETLEAIKEFGFQSIIIYPNADAGGRKMIKTIKEYRKYSFVQIYKNLSRFEYLSLMKRAKAIIGNSSSGIIEAPSFYLPAINIGTRQAGREKAENVIDVDYKKNEIKKAIKVALFDKKFKEKLKRIKNPYGEGTAGVKIADILSKIKIDKKLLQKKISY